MKNLIDMHKYVEELMRQNVKKKRKKNVLELINRKASG